MSMVENVCAADIAGRHGAALPTRGRWQDVAWVGKSIDSAHWGVETLPDGRVHCWIAHELVKGVTPTMLVWWFTHLEGVMSYEARRVKRYRVWHPRDHIAVRYAKLNDRGEVGPGAVLHIREMFGGDPRNTIDSLSRIERLDEGGFEHRPQLHGIPVAHMAYSFEAVNGGTLYRNSLTVGFTGWLGRVLNPLIRVFKFDAARGRAWVKHNAEEVGQFEEFLPELYAAEARGDARAVS
jgi:hypothetical protein